MAATLALEKRKEDVGSVLVAAPVRHEDAYANNCIDRAHWPSCALRLRKYDSLAIG